jgi:parallel beta-helix repeat protein
MVSRRLPYINFYEVATSAIQRKSARIRLDNCGTIEVYKKLTLLVFLILILMTPAVIAEVGTITGRIVQLQDVLWIEAERGEASGDFQIVYNDSTSNGSYIWIPDGTGWKPRNGEIVYNFRTESGGNYVIWGRVYSPTNSDNSFFVQLDSGVEYLWTISTSEEWHWDMVNDWGNGTEDNPETDPVFFSLSPGNHTLRIKQREDGTKLDVLVITNNLSYIPPVLDSTVSSMEISILSPENRTYDSHRVELNFSSDYELIDCILKVDDTANQTISCENQSVISREYEDEKCSLWYHFNDNLIDYSGNNNSALIDGADFAEGKFGSSLYFDGNSFVEVSNSPSFDLVNITIEVWVKPELGQRGSIINKYVYDYTIPINERVFELDITEEGHIQFALSSDGTVSGTEWLRSARTVEDGVWTHIAVTSDGDKMRIYINGEQDENTADAPEVIHSSPFNVYIGAWKYSPSDNAVYFRGSIDELRVLNRSLTQEEILSDYALGSGEHSLVLYGRDSEGIWRTGTTTFRIGTRNDTTPPEIIIISAPSGAIEFHNATFSWEGWDDLTAKSSLLYSFKLENYSDWSVWTSETTHTFFNLPDGDYTFRVKARDIAGNEGHPAEAHFRVYSLPPQSISNLSASSGVTWINWTWKNPDDADFSHVMVYMDSKFVENTTENFYNATELSPDTLHTLSTRTVDLYGNINDTWMNYSSATVETPVNYGTKPEILSFNPASYIEIAEGDTVIFSAEINYPSNCRWSFGDITLEWDNLTTSPSFTHRFESQGIFEVRLTAFNLTNTSLLTDTMWQIKVDVREEAITVCPTCEFNSIQAAVDSAKAGDTIIVKGGTYYESVFINKKIILRGIEDGGIMPGIISTGDAVTLNANGIMIEGLTISTSAMSKSAIKVKSENNTIKNNILKDSYYGVYLYYSKNNRVLNNELTDNYYAIRLYKSENNLIENNLIRDGKYAVYLYSSDNNVLRGNDITNNYYGVFLLYSEGNIIYNNTIEDSKYYGLYMYASDNNIISENIARENYYGFRLYSSSGNTLFLNILENSYNVYDTGTNQWDNNSRGNHYSNFDESSEGCFDLNGDGICDNEYAIPGGQNIDRHPLIQI